jgi:hypothetical protein
LGPIPNPQSPIPIPIEYIIEQYINHLRKIKTYFTKTTVKILD